MNEPTTAHNVDAEHLLIKPVYAHRAHAGEPSRLVGFDMNEPTAHNRGKPTAIARIRQRNPYNTIIMIGDGITDLEAVQVRYAPCVGLLHACYKHVM
jgi:phosphoglycolate phosphatase-like HAD superfamily hydrolase